jgi:ubiquinone/menaquinone biosynthesis C-methylase UbiE
MTDDLSLKSFTSLDRVDNVPTYIRALEAFDEIEQMQEIKRIARALIRPASSVLDVGCGFGLETMRLAALVTPAGTVAGIDKSADFIAEAQRRAAAAGTRIDFRVGDADKLPWPDRAFDNVRAERLLIYLDDPRQAVAEMKRVVRPGGSLAFIEPEFGSTTINLSDRAVVRRAMAHEAETAVAQSWLPGPLAGMLADLGLRDIAVTTRVAIFPQDLAAEYFSTVGRNARRDGPLSQQELDAWLAEIADLKRRGRLFGTVGYFLFTARS